MPKIESLIRELAKHALSKKGAQQDSSWGLHDVWREPHVELSHNPEWGCFFEVDQEEDEHFARLPVLAEALKRHREKHPVIRESSWIERDDHIYMEVPLDAGLPVAFLKSLIDDAYALVWNKLDTHGQLLIELADLPYDEAKLMDRLIEMHSLQEHRKEIRKLARHAILLRTKKSSEAKILSGTTKIGGRPDLPAKTEWPLYRDGKPLAFLAQINLAEIAKLGTPIKGLPSDGLLSVFSVWGWMADDDLDPQTPNDRTEAVQEEKGWTVVLDTRPQAKLQRRQTPRGVNSFKAAVVEPTPILSLPKHSIEPPLAALNWTDDEYERFDQMQSDYCSLQMSHWLQNSDAFASHHLLGGYALFQQAFLEEVLEKGLAMFLQIGTDGNTEMCWGDGGELTFYADAKALARGRLERLWGTCQGG
ncbi:MAG TPA: DUF1963 domain-containing protein [Gemmataceae bacterium]|jgi:uncharacterized protein YwqG/predicted DNA-binding protein (MmcQ/YjbR family)